MPVKPKKDDIKKAVEKIPGLFFEQVEFTSPKENRNEKKVTPPKVNYQQEKKKKGLMWLGVIILTIVIIIMWAWSTFVNFDTLSKKDTNSLLDQAKESFEQAKQKTEILEPTTTTPTTTEENLSEEEIKLKIKNRLTSIVNELNTTTTSSTEINLTTTGTPQFNLSTTSIDVTRTL